MHAKPSFAHRLQTAKMASSRTSAQNNGPRAQKNGPWGYAAFLHLQCANCPFWPLVSKYTILAPVRKMTALGRKKIALGCNLIALG